MTDETRIERFEAYRPPALLWELMVSGDLSKGHVRALGAMVEAATRDEAGRLVCEDSIEDLSGVLGYSREHLHSIAGDLTRAGLVETKRRQRENAIRILREA